jgi:hypothetical protein
MGLVDWSRKGCIEDGGLAKGCMEKLLEGKERMIGKQKKKTEEILERSK